MDHQQKKPIIILFLKDFLDLKEDSLNQVISILNNPNSRFKTLLSRISIQEDFLKLLVIIDRKYKNLEISKIPNFNQRSHQLGSCPLTILIKL